MWSIQLIVVALGLMGITYVLGSFFISHKQLSSELTVSEKICASIIVGTLAIILCVGWISYLGGTVRLASNIILGLFLIVFATGLLKRDYQFRIDKGSCILMGAIVLMLFLALLPILRYSSFNPYQDTFTYISIADYIGTHSFSKIIKAAYTEPMLSQASAYQANQFRMGAIFFLSFAAQFFHILRSIEIYPCLAAFAGILNLLSIYYFSSRILKLKNLTLFVISIFTVILFNPLYYALHNGFFPQLFGMAFLLFFVACLEQQLKEVSLKKQFPWIILSMFTAAGLISAYSEFAPLVVLTFVFAITKHLFVEKCSIKKLINIVTLNVIFLVIFANIELIRMIHALSIQMHCVVGWNVDFSLMRFIATAFGIQSGFVSINLLSLQGLIYCILLGSFIALFILGVYKAIKSKNTIWLIPLIIFSLMFFYFTQVNNPFIPGQKWQTWSLFKISNWVFPFFIVGVGYGFATINRYRNLIAGLLILLVMVYAIPLHNQESKYLSVAAISNTHSTEPFSAYSQLGDLVKTINVSAYHNQPIELRISNQKHRQLIVYYLYPLPVYADFSDDGYIYNGLGKKDSQIDSLKNNLILSSYDHIDPSFTPLPAGVTIGGEVLLTLFNNGWYGKEEDFDKNVWYWSNGKSELMVENYRDARKFLMNCQIQATTLPMHVTFYSNKKELKTIEINKPGLNDVSIPVEFVSGKNTVKIVSNKEGVKLGQDPRLLAFRLQNLEWKSI